MINRIAGSKIPMTGKKMAPSSLFDFIERRSEKRETCVLEVDHVAESHSLADKK